MKKLFISIILFISFASAELPVYDASSIIVANGEPITMDVGCASPCVTDWNLDGKKDLIVGQFKNGKMRYYENIGTNANPQFGDYVFMQADGEDISLEAS